MMETGLNQKMQTPHQLRIEEFMRAAGQCVPRNPLVPPMEIRRLRAELILEEAIETIYALGFSVVQLPDTSLIIQPYGANVFDLAAIVDGCVDTSVVAIGTLSACGVQDDPMLQLVDANNLDKIKRGTRGPSGKFLKPADHKPPDIQTELERQGFDVKDPYGFDREDPLISGGRAI